VDDQVERAFGLDEKSERRTIADVEVIMAKMTGRLDQPLLIPLCVAFLTKEVGAHVVVDSDNALGASIKESDKLRTNETTGACDEYLHVCFVLFY